MPFIESKLSVKTTQEQQKTLKERLGQAISLIPGKSESWLMVDRRMIRRCTSAVMTVSLSRLSA